MTRIVLQSDNEISIDMHIKVKFEEIKRNLKYPGDKEGMASGILFCQTFLNSIQKNNCHIR